MTIRHISAKRAWARLGERATLGEKFGFIACAELLLRQGKITREQVVDLFNAARITRSDLTKFREQTNGGGDQTSRSAVRDSNRALVLAT